MASLRAPDRRGLSRLTQGNASSGSHVAPAGGGHGERDVLTLIGRGLSNTEIAADLTLSIATVKTYVTRLLTTLDARDRVQLVIIAYDAGLVAPAR
jgi:DNA-binding NarL/FixJ family response regulator